MLKISRSLQQIWIGMRKPYRHNSKMELNKSIMTQLIKQDIPQGLQDLYLAAVTADSWLTELKSIFWQPQSTTSKTDSITSPSFPALLIWMLKSQRKLEPSDKLPGAERQRWNQLALCFYWEPRHIIKNCPSKTSQVRQQTAQQCLHYSSPGQQAPPFMSSWGSYPKHWMEVNYLHTQVH